MPRRRRGDYQSPKGVNTGPIVFQAGGSARPRFIGGGGFTPPILLAGSIAPLEQKTISLLQFPQSSKSFRFFFMFIQGHWHSVVFVFIGVKSCFTLYRTVELSVIFSYRHFNMY